MKDGRIAKGFERVQIMWEDTAGRNKGGRRRDPRETVAQTVAYGLLGVRAVWKLRCEMVNDAALSSQLRKLMAEVEVLKMKRDEVGAADRGLFRIQNIPNAEKGIDKIDQWVRSVRNSIVRRRERDERSHRRIEEYFEPQEKSGPQRQTE